MIRRATAAAFAVCLASAAPAAAHPGHDSRIVVERVTPAVKGVDVVALTDGVGKVRLSTTGSTVAEVLAKDGTPILRVGPQGVEANTTAPDWYRVNEPLGIAQVPPTAKPGAQPRFKKVSAARSWEWFDHRFHPGTKPIFRWAIPLRVDGKNVEVRGHIAAAGGSFQISPTGVIPTGLSVSGVSGPLPSINLANTGRRPVTVLAPGGEPFARITAKGAELNVHSSLWIPTAQVRNQSLLDSVVDPNAAPKFVPAGPTAELIWPDPRIVPTAEEILANKPKRWTLPLRTADGKRVTIAGTTTLVATKPERPPTTSTAPSTANQTPSARAAAATDDDGGSTTGILLGAAAGIVVLAGGALLFARRRSRARV